MNSTKTATPVKREPAPPPDPTAKWAVEVLGCLDAVDRLSQLGTLFPPSEGDPAARAAALLSVWNRFAKHVDPAAPDPKGHNLPLTFTLRGLAEGLPAPTPGADPPDATARGRPCEGQQDKDLQRQQAQHRGARRGCWFQLSLDVRTEVCWGRNTVVRVEGVGSPSPLPTGERDARQVVFLRSGLAIPLPGAQGHDRPAAPASEATAVAP